MEIMLAMGLDHIFKPIHYLTNLSNFAIITLFSNKYFDYLSKHYEVKRTLFSMFNLELKAPFL